MEIFLVFAWFFLVFGVREVRHQIPHAEISPEPDPEVLGPGFDPCFGLPRVFLALPIPVPVPRTVFLSFSSLFEGFRARDPSQKMRHEILHLFGLILVSGGGQGPELWPFQVFPPSPTPCVQIKWVNLRSTHLVCVFCKPNGWI